MAPSAQLELVALEKANAPAQQQVEQAAEYVGIVLSFEDNYKKNSEDAVAYHGKVDWALKWLLKKMTAEMDFRSCPSAWLLFSALGIRLPVRTAAKTMHDRKFMQILATSVESLATATVTTNTETTATKKRKRNGEPVSNISSINGSGVELYRAIYQAISCLVDLCKARNITAFEAEYMKSILRSSAAEAGKLLGLWLSIVVKRPTSKVDAFAYIWTARIKGDEDVQTFSKTCLAPALTLLASTEIAPPSRSLLEQLLAVNVLSSSKNKPSASQDQANMKAILNDAVTLSPSHAAIVLDIAARCTELRENNRRKTVESEWLQVILLVLIGIIDDWKSPSGDLAIKLLLGTCVEHHIDPGSDVLQKIAWTRACNGTKVDWEAVSLIIKLDASVFSTNRADHDAKSLQSLLCRYISDVHYKEIWSNTAHAAVVDVAVALMESFVVSRHLDAFVRLWHSELAYLEPAMAGAVSSTNSVWEHEALQEKLQTLLEAHLGAEQIVSVLQHVRATSGTCPGAALVIADVVTCAIHNDETVDHIGAQICSMAYDLLNETKIPQIWRWRIFRIARHTFQWQTPLHESDEWNRLRQRAEESASSLLPQHKKRATDEDEKQTAFEVFRWFCCLWSSETGAKDNKDQYRKYIIAYRPLIDHMLADTIKHIKSSEHVSAEPLAVETQSLSTATSRTIDAHGPFGACAYARCVLVEYPLVLQLLENTQDSNNGSRTLLYQAIWIASAFSSPDSFEPSMLQTISKSFSLYWFHLLQDERLHNAPETMGLVVDSILAELTHSTSPYEPSEVFDRFSVQCLLQVPLEAFTRSQRESILVALGRSAADSPTDSKPVDRRMAAMDPGILSLKMRIMQRPTFYAGMKFQNLMDTADAVAKLSNRPKNVMPVFIEYVQLTLRHILATVDQTRSHEYLAGLFASLNIWLDQNKKAKEPLQFATVELVKAALQALSQKSSVLASSNICSEEDLNTIRHRFQKTLLKNVQRIIEKPKKLEGATTPRFLSLESTISALQGLNISSSQLDFLMADNGATLSAIKDTNTILGYQLHSLIVQSNSTPSEDILDIDINGDVADVAGRRRLIENADAVSAGLESEMKLALAMKLVNAALDTLSMTTDLVAARRILESCADSKDIVLEQDNLQISLSVAYSMLAERLPSVEDLRDYCLITETMNMLLRTKARVITQYNIDTTMSVIARLCSPASPSLPARHASTIFTHLTDILQTVLLSHRLKLQGHYHLIVQTLQVLLACLYTPTTANSAKTSLPPWRCSPEPIRLTAKHAQAFTRLLTILCDPSSSTVSQSTSSTLNSATAKAKRLIAQHIPIVLASYIKFQLDLGLRMDPEVRSALVPGIWAIFDCMTVEGRRVLGESLDAGGRRILSDLIKDWTRFGKWTGS